MNREADIIIGLQAGSDSAYEYLYKHYYKMLCTVAFERVRDTLVSEMIVSDVIFALWKNRQTLEIHASLRSYLLKSVHNRCLNYIAQSERQQALLDELSQKIASEQACDANSPDNPLTLLIENELETKINGSIEALPDQTRRIFCMSRFDEMTYDEIAYETGVSVDVVKYHIKRALARLRNALKDYLMVLIVCLSAILSFNDFFTDYFLP